MESNLLRMETIEGVTSAAIKPKALLIPKSNGRSPATAVICATDWHSEANVQADLVNGLNEFSLETCQRRVNRLWEKSVYLIEFARSICDIQDAVLWLGGDLINGYIHEELEENNFAGPTEAIVFIQELVATGIETLLKKARLQSLRVVCNYGNHGRATQKRRVSTGWKTSWEWLGYSTLAARRFPSEVSWEIARGYHSHVDIQGHVVRFHHGDFLQYHGGVGGITIPVNKALAQWNQSRPARYDVFGHWHQYLETWSWTACGCLVGYDPYALSIKASYQDPTQTFLVFDKKWGKTMSIPIFVGEKP